MPDFFPKGRVSGKSFLGGKTQLKQKGHNWDLRTLARYLTSLGSKAILLALLAVAATNGSLLPLPSCRQRACFEMRPPLPQNFYSAVANELLKVGVNAALPIWMAEGAGADPDGFVSHPGTLFPRPLPPAAPAAQVSAVSARFRFLGSLMAKASRDNFIVPDCIISCLPSIIS